MSDKTENVIIHAQKIPAWMEEAIREIMREEIAKANADGRFRTPSDNMERAARVLAGIGDKP